MSGNSFLLFHLLMIIIVVKSVVNGCRKKNKYSPSLRGAPDACADRGVTRRARATRVQPTRLKYKREYFISARYYFPPSHPQWNPVSEELLTDGEKPLGNFIAHLMRDVKIGVIFDHQVKDIQIRAIFWIDIHISAIFHHQEREKKEGDTT